MDSISYFLRKYSTVIRPAGDETILNGEEDHVTMTKYTKEYRDGKKYEIDDQICMSKPRSIPRERGSLCDNSPSSVCLLFTRLLSANLRLRLGVWKL